MSSKKQVKYGQKPPDSTKIPRVPDAANQLDGKLFKWRVSPNYTDYEHQEWGWGQVPITEFFDMLIDRLHNYEDMTWQDLLSRKHCHGITVDRIDNKAQDRLREVCRDIDVLHQIDFGKLGRLWGYRDRRTFFLIWRDKKHTVYKCKR